MKALRRQRFSQFALAGLLILLPGVLRAQTPPARPPITGIARVSVYASAPSRSQTFYSGLLGFSARESKTHPGGWVYRVSRKQSIAVDPLAPDQTDYLESVAFSTNDVRALRRYLIAKHVRIPDGVQTSSDGLRHLWLLDPEGHRIEFVEVSAEEPTVGKGASPPAWRTPQPVSRHILHAGFIVHNRGAEDHFFRDILGFREGWHGGMAEGRTDWIDMQVPDGTDWIEYMLHDASPVSPHTSGVLNHFALGVPSVRRAASLLEHRGWHKSDEENPQIGRDGKWQLNLYDPDGTRVEIMEFRPVRTPCCSAYTLRPPARIGREHSQAHPEAGRLLGK